MEPLYVPTRSECNAATEQARADLIAAGIAPGGRWDLDNMTCSHGNAPGDHIEDVDPPAPRTVSPAEPVRLAGGEIADGPYGA